jgi:hypothetical protein
VAIGNRDFRVRIGGLFINPRHTREQTLATVAKDRVAETFLKGFV